MNSLFIKLFIIFLIFNIFIFIIANSCLAVSKISFEYDGQSLSASLDSSLSDFNYVFIDVSKSMYNTYSYNICFSTSEPVFYYSSSNRLSVKPSSDTLYMLSFLGLSDLDSVSSSISSIKSDDLESHDISGSSFSSASTFVFSTFDIKDTDGNLVFQAAPQEGEQTMILTKITSVDFSQVMMEVLAMLPILLVVLIGLLALRKAIQLLLKTLRQS